ncbi:MAG: biotin--[acetyl-CoA-carboxylase] ligase [Candidatus Fluviicola riflensis]|nr:MAG: biotin--[acetyl-CoA-carboxylase] ligase [Candidatus Fluviicola riflensis]OGS76159.1 MAG: biotin--[acetyl-CoA-carboxylase] ligase [Candidatus Fluviicola riflensis]OGS83297.1 MAG: biotin--[acetyl-CoA-carboxylase] ligase [Fluviicola sp. RIFCSPHIGHO2_01_FULL_43_53]OGS83691.1 MAG: biotin--[acetyl-CoA-carboxylase] ligase [Fluviicola sp. RIFCSPHIGHO2_12_FULL_43_24]
MIGQKIILLDEVDSTNNYTAKLLNEGKMAHGTVILAEKQTAGRGQRGSLWHSASGKQFTCSVYTATAFLSVERYWYLNLAVALAVRETIQAFILEKAVIKWPNDILVNDKKIAGILIETQWNSGNIMGAIIGVGINLQRESDLSSSCSLVDFTDNNPEILEMARQLSSLLELQFERLRSGNWNEILQDYHAMLWKKDVLMDARIENDWEEGYIRGIDGIGNLLFEVNGEERSFGLKEIAFAY